MPSGPRIRSNSEFGTITDNPLTAGGTTFSSARLALFPVVSSAHAVVTLDPRALNGEPEIVIVTAHTAAAITATITRGAYGTVARSHPSGTEWISAPLDEDFIEIVTSSTRPSDPYRGQPIYETDTDRLVIRNQSDVWQDAIPLGAWQTGWSPAINQGGAVSTSVEVARWTRMGRFVIASFRVAASGGGIANNPVFVSLPVAGRTGGPSYAVGPGWIIDVTVQTYNGTWNMDTVTGTRVSLIHDGSGTSGSPFGVAPNVALAGSDVMSGMITYEAAA